MDSSNLFDIKRKIDEQVYGAPANVLVKVLGYTDDFTAMLTELCAPDASKFQYQTSELEIPKLMKVTLAELTPDTIKRLRGKRSTIKNRATESENAYLSGNADTGGLCFLQQLEVSNETSEEVYSDGDESRSAEFTHVKARWIKGVIDATPGRNAPATEKLVHPIHGCGVSMHYREANEEYGKPFGCVKILNFRNARQASNIGEVEGIISKHFETNLPKIEAFVIVRLSDGKDAISKQLTRRSKQIDGQWHDLRGSQALQHAKVHKRERFNWSAITQMLDVAGLPGNEHFKIEVLCGFLEYFSEKQLQDSNLFDANGKFINDEKRDYYESHWTIDTGVDREGRLDSYYESIAVLRRCKLEEGGWVWVLAGHVPVRGGTTSFLGASSMLKTDAYSPNEDIKKLIKDFKNTTFGSTDEPSEVSSANTTGVSAAIQQGMQHPPSESIVPDSDMHGFEIEESFEPEVMR